MSEFILRRPLEEPIFFRLVLRSFFNSIPCAVSSTKRIYRRAKKSIQREGISGVFVRLTTCKRLTNSLPKLSKPYNAPPPLKRRYCRSTGCTDGPVNMSKPFFFPGYTEESNFQVRHGENLKKCIKVDVGFKPTTPNTHGLSTTPFLKVLVGWYQSV